MCEKCDNPLDEDEEPMHEIAVDVHVLGIVISHPGGIRGVFIKALNRVCFWLGMELEPQVRDKKTLSMERFLADEVSDTVFDKMVDHLYRMKPTERAAVLASAPPVVREKLAARMAVYDLTRTPHKES